MHEKTSELVLKPFFYLCNAMITKIAAVAHCLFCIGFFSELTNIQLCHRCVRAVPLHVWHPCRWKASQQISWNYRNFPVVCRNGKRTFLHPYIIPHLYVKVNAESKKWLCFM